MYRSLSLSDTYHRTIVPFTIDPETGTVNVSRTLDISESQQYILPVEAFDGLWKAMVSPVDLKSQDLKRESISWGGESRALISDQVTYDLFLSTANLPPTIDYQSISCSCFLFLVLTIDHIESVRERSRGS